MVTKAQQQVDPTQTDQKPNLYQRIYRARQHFTPIVKNKVNPHFKNKFADLDSVVSAVEQALTDEGVLIVGLAQPSTADSWLVGIRLVNIDNPEDSTAQFIPCNTFDAQKQGAAITYARRYLLCLMLNLLAEDDDDVNSVSGNLSTNGTGSTTAVRVPSPTTDW
jgi:hypothetical protein